MKNFNQFISEGINKFVNVNYKIIVRDSKDNPELLVTDFKIISSEDRKLKIKAKGYINTYLEIEGKKRKGWIAFDDFKDDKTRNIWNKHFENGTKKIKIYEN